MIQLVSVGEKSKEILLLVEEVLGDVEDFGGVDPTELTVAASTESQDEAGDVC